MSFPTPPQRFPPEVALQFFKKGIVVPGFTREELIQLYQRSPEFRRRQRPPEPLRPAPVLPAVRPAVSPQPGATRAFPAKTKPITAPPQVVPDVTFFGIQQRQAKERHEQYLAGPPITERILKGGVALEQAIFGEDVVQIGKVVRAGTERFAPVKEAKPAAILAGVVASAEGIVRPVPMPSRAIEREFPGFGGGFVVGSLVQSLVASKIGADLAKRIGPIREADILRERRIREIERAFGFGLSPEQEMIGRLTGKTFVPIQVKGQPPELLQIPFRAARQGVLEASESLRFAVPTKAARIEQAALLQRLFKTEAPFTVLTTAGRQVLTPSTKAVSDIFRPFTKGGFSVSGGAAGQVTVTRGAQITPFQVTLAKVRPEVVTTTAKVVAKAPIIAATVPILKTVVTQPVKEKVVQPPISRAEVRVEPFSALVTMPFPALVTAPFPSLVAETVPLTMTRTQAKAIQETSQRAVLKQAQTVGLQQLTRQTLRPPRLITELGFRPPRRVPLKDRKKRKKKKRKPSERELLIGRIERLYPIALPSELLRQFI